jgi:hypothetical protein
MLLTVPAVLNHMKRRSKTGEEEERMEEEEPMEGT